MRNIILDRDGVINQNPPNFGYVCDWSEFAFLPSSIRAISDLTYADFNIIIATNQAGIGRGIITQEQLHKIHSNMVSTLRNAGGIIKNIYFCPHHPDAGCECRKPKPGMLQKAIQDHCFDPSTTHFIGDSISDIKAAKNADIAPVLVLTGHGLDTYQHYASSQFECRKYLPDKIFTNLFSASQWLIQEYV
ncbi:D-glycero-beta-D-manno-heptose 1,7-bisphosphate 7-phosphatase [Candidatus Poribacteria bacterium]|nr:D-glycero-beta-D-manno-heptose 1,7-bisphosphate 7-phosphatase [Candidatus Poribacteria bacterium]